MASAVKSSPEQRRSDRRAGPDRAPVGPSVVTAGASGLAAAIDNSPRMLAQRLQIGRIFGAAAAGPATVQRMVDADAPDDGSDWATIERYLDRTLINQRQQTFAQAIEEYIATGVTGAGAVDVAWRAIAALRGQVGQELVALGHIRTIRTTINVHKSDVPDHPNKRGITADQERYETVPQSAESQRIAYTLQATLLTDLLGGYKERTYTRHGKPVKARTYLDPVTRRRTTLNGYWSTSFMLGVLVRPDGAVLVSHSGYMGAEQGNAFVAIVGAAGYLAVDFGDAAYADAQASYLASLNRTTLPADHAVKKDSKSKNKVVNQPRGRAKIEEGNPVGVCAAAQVLDGPARLAGDFPAELTGDIPMAMTEVWVAQPTSNVQVRDVHRTQQRYSGQQDVPSCLTCQHQLREVLRRLTDLRRNVLNREDAISEQEGEGAALYDVALQLERTMADAGPLLARVLGGAGVAQAVDLRGDLVALRDRLDEYRQAIETVAKARTQHPDHIGHDDKRAVPRLNTLADAEDRARAEFDNQAQEAWWSKRLALGQLIGGEAYNAEREKASEAYNVSGKAEQANGRRNAQTEVEARAQVKHDHLLGIAFGLARTYDSSVTAELRRLLREAAEGPRPEDPRPHTDFSDEYIG